MSPVPQTSSLGFVEGVAQPLEKRFEVIKEVGDGSFGSVVLARVRGTRNMVSPSLPSIYTLEFERLMRQVAVKSMKKSFDSFSECLRLREVQVLVDLFVPI
jgi:meiosis induction protein kinase IME2/SME1